MGVGMLRTLAGAGFADFGAQGAELGGMGAAPRHEACGKPADRRAVLVELDAAHHHGQLFFIETGGGAVIAGIRTGIAGGNAGLV